MNVRFEPGVLRDSRSFRHLTALFWLFVDGRHKWSADAATILDSPWYTGLDLALRRPVRDMVHAAERTPAPRGATLVHVDAGTIPSFSPTEWHLPPAEAERVLRRPVVLLVENAPCDGAFLRLVLLRIGDRKARRILGDALYEQVKNRWTGPLGDGDVFQVVHGGGSETAEMYRWLLDSHPEVVPRIFVLVDSDREGAAAPPRGTAARVLEIAHGRNPVLEPHVLTRREVENYIPGEVLKAFKAGAPYQEWADLPDKDFADLKRIFGKDLRTCFLEPRFQPLFHAGALRERNAGPELDQIAHALLSLL